MTLLCQAARRRQHAEGRRCSTLLLAVFGRQGAPVAGTAEALVKRRAPASSRTRPAPSSQPPEWDELRRETQEPSSLWRLSAPCQELVRLCAGESLQARQEENAAAVGTKARKKKRRKRTDLKRAVPELTSFACCGK